MTLAVTTTRVVVLCSEQQIYTGGRRSSFSSFSVAAVINDTDTPLTQQRKRDRTLGFYNGAIPYLGRRIGVNKQKKTGL